jgi:large subunit ribosomal protein L35
MPKLKTKRGAAKRFQTTKSGGIKRHKAGASHILASKTRKRKRRLRRPDSVNVADQKNIRKLIPYSF